MTASAEPHIPGTRWRMWTAIGTHTVVDFFSFLIVPLLSVLEGHVGIRPEQGALLLAIGQVSSGIIQPVVAIASDRFDTRWLGTLGFLAAVVAIGLVGSVRTFEQLLILQIIGTAGIGAFHPVAAAAVGHLAGPRRSMGIAWFYMAGMLGGILGNISAGHYVERFARAGGSTASGLAALAYLIPVGLVFVGALAVATHGVAHRTHDAHALHRELPARERSRRWAGVWVLYAGNVLRFAADVCLIQLIVRWSEAIAIDRAPVDELTEAVRIQASQINGPLQAAKQVGMGLGGVALGWLFHVRHERALLVVTPLLGAALIAALPSTHGWGALVVCAAAGVGYGAVVPLTISMAQRLIPHRTSLASGLMMGGAWAVASVGSPIAQRLADAFGLDRAFLIVAGVLCLASVFGLLVPRSAERGSAA
ncbi:MAG: MFS transporter [Phycisphaeraceae bacterium]|nr:MFS transporter [Phycisphaeraceae bacterium]MBX3406069.1 MFS transporter [Phycisphaeraceae bacterium]